MFHLPLRQTEGFVGSLLRLMGLDLKAPDHSTLSRRGENVEVPPLCRDHEGPIHLVVDSTGLRICGAGGWSSRKHRNGKVRRSWRKLHIGVDDDGFVVAAQLTESKRGDASVVPDLLEQTDAKVKRFTGNGAYDRKLVYDKLAGTGTEDVVVVVPPRRTAAPDKNAEGAWLQRNSHLERIEEIGRRAWLKESGYRQQARAETAADFTAFHWLELGRAQFDLAADLGFRLRQDGFTVPPTDLVIAASAIDSNATLYHLDAHYDRIARHSALQATNLKPGPA